ncbi:hypothetical protein [Streptomyces sp. NPDC001970]
MATPRSDRAPGALAARPVRRGGRCPWPGPVPMHVTYTFALCPRRTRARIRLRGGPGGPYRLAEPLMARKVRISITKDLRDLERTLPQH